MSEELQDDVVIRGLTDIEATKAELLSAVEAGANQADIRRLERAVWQLFDRSSAARALLASNNTLRARLSRLSALLDEAEAALGKVPSIEFADIGQVETQRFINAAASVAAKIAALKDPADV